MELKTKQTIEKEVEAYLNKTANHLFICENPQMDFMYKVIPLYNEGKLYYATIMMRQDKVLIETHEAVSDYHYKHSGNGTANAFKKGVFQEYFEVKSIPNFKRMKALMEMVKAEIKFDKESNKVLSEKIMVELSKIYLERIAKA